ncbi:MAG: FAD-dependent oxidoreductase, partial [Acetobacteraceae bacterium]
AISAAIEGTPSDLPVLRDPDGHVYFKEEVGGLAFGGFEPNAKPWGMNGIPEHFEFQLLPDDWEQFEPLMKNALIRAPALERTEIKSFINGPESFTPDGGFILGAAPEVSGIFLGYGFNSAGIASAGGAGRALALWMLEGAPPFDLWPVDPRRFARLHGNPRWLRDRVKESLGLHYAMAWPNREPESARPMRRSPLYDRLAAKGAVFGSKMGWEHPLWFAPRGRKRRNIYSFGPQNWASAVAAEHRACRERVAIFDMTASAKFFLEGRDAERVLQLIAANDIAVSPGQTVSTPLLNPKGGIESNLAAARLAPDRFLLISGATQATRDADWIRRHTPSDANAVLTDMTSAFAVIAVMGPEARRLLAPLTPAGLDDAAFPFGAIREITMGYATLWAARRGATGELGFELIVPTEFAAGVYDRIAAAGKKLGAIDAGAYASESLRIEKGLPAWGRDITSDCTPFDAGLDWCVRLDKPQEFIGRHALLAARAKPPAQRLAAFLAVSADAPLAWGGEIVAADGLPIGEITSAAFGATVERLVALGWVRSAGEPIDQAWLEARAFTVDIAGRAVPLRASLRPFYDPTGSRMHA